MIAAEDKDFPLQCWNEGSQSAPIYQVNDLMSAQVSPGEGTPPLFAASVAWWTAPDPGTGIATQDGFDQGQVLVTVAAADSATLIPEATYQLEVWRQPAGTTRKFCVWRGALVAGWSAGGMRSRLPTYGSYEEMLDYAPWARFLADQSAVEAGFYDQRLQARVWVDEAVTRSFRGSALYPFGTPAVPANFWSGWAGPWRGPMPSIWVRDMLWGSQVITTKVLNPGSGYTSAPTITAPPPAPWIGLDPAAIAQRQKPARFFGNVAGGGLRSVLIGDAGLGYAPGITLNLAIAGGGGSGAQATAYVSPGTLMRRPQLGRIATFKALELLGLSQIGANPQHVAYGHYFGGRVAEEMNNYVAELDVNNDGWPDTAIPCYITNTIYM
jgi:hypothetical protein